MPSAMGKIERRCKILTGASDGDMCGHSDHRWKYGQHQKQNLQLAMCLVLPVSSVLGGRCLAQTRGVIKYRRLKLIHLSISVAISVSQNHTKGKEILLKTIFCRCDKAMWKVSVLSISHHLIMFEPPRIAEVRYADTWRSKFYSQS
jgi:hypothetical protein